MKNKSFAAALAAGGSVTVLGILLSWAHLVLPLAILIGVVAGALVSYLSYRPAKTWSGMKVTWRETEKWTCTRVPKGVLFLRRQLQSLIVGYFVKRWAGALFLFGPYFIWAKILADKGSESPMEAAAMFWLASLVFLIIYQLIGLVFVEAGLQVISEKYYRPAWLSPKQPELFTIFGEGWAWDLPGNRNWIPFVFLVLPLLGVLFDVALLVYLCIHLLLSMPRFIRTLNRAIHSEMRTMALVDGPLGGLAAFLIALRMRGESLLHDPAAMQLSIVGLGAVCALLLGYFNCLVIARRGLGIQPKV